MNSLFKTSAAAALIAVIYPTNANEVSTHLTTIIEPTPIKRVNPKYPMDAAKNNREGWAKLSFVIGTDGLVSNVLVTETSGSKDFAAAASRAVSQWEFTPAFADGKAIEQCVNTVQMNFKMDSGGAQGATRKFRRKYEKALAALQAKDYEQTKQVLDEMSKIKKMHLSESNYMHLLAADYAQQINDKPLQLFHLRRVWLDTTNEENAERELSTLNSILMLEISLNQLQNAYGTYKRIIKREAAAPYLENYKKLIGKIDAFIGSDKNIVVQGNIKEDDFWYAALVRKEFSIIDVKGALNKLDIRCANKRHVYSLEENNTWKLPDSWGKCSIYVYGEDNATFNLVEHPQKS